MVMSIDGCTACAGASGIYGCPIHAPNIYETEEPQPFVQLWLRCPCCGQDLRFDGFKIEQLTNKGG